MINLIATPLLGGAINWQDMQMMGGNMQDGVRVSYNTSSFRGPVLKRDAIAGMKSVFEANDVNWIKQGANRWEIDLDGLAEFVPTYKGIPWFKGKVSLEPEFEPLGEDEFMSRNGSKWYKASVAFYITQDAILCVGSEMTPPPEIEGSLKLFRQAFPRPTKIAFVMMPFGQSKAHTAIIATIRAALEPYGIRAVRADDQEFHDDLFPNILTYLFACDFGIAVYERIETEHLNPNVSLEVGYMLSMKKPVCLLKDSTLKTLNTDLLGKLYRPFDTQDPAASIPSHLIKWAQDKKILN